MRIFLTGASGCVGHYIAETLITETPHELFLLVRNPAKFKVDYRQRPGVTLLEGDLAEIEQFAEILKTINVAILTATSWGDPQTTQEINVNKTLALINLLDQKVCEQVIYFSTESILDRHNQLLPEAYEIGTDYIRTKYECYQKLTSSAIASKTTIIFPTLVLGGDDNKPYSHLSGGFGEIPKYVPLLRWFKADGSFHFIHAKDIAVVIKYLINNPPDKLRKFVLGNEPLTVDETVEEICNYFGKRIYFRVPLSMDLANFFIKIFNIKMADWDRFCLNNRHFIHEDYVNPNSFGEVSYYPTLTDVFKAQVPR